MKEPVWIDLRDALAIHDRLLVLYGGAQGTRDETLLESALARPRQIYAYAEEPDLVDLGAALMVGVVTNRPFVDGNKRTGFLLGALFLEINGLAFSATEEDATLAVRALAAGAWQEAAFTKWVRANVTAIGQRKRGDTHA